MKQNNSLQTVVRLNLQYLCLNSPIENLNVKIDDVIHVNDINMYDIAVMENFDSVNVVINTHLKREIVVSIRKIIHK